MGKATTATEQTIAYKGNADVRRITKQDWKRAGIDHDTVEWNADNNHTVSRSDLSNEAWAKIEKDSDFKLSETEVQADANGDNKTP